MRRKRIIWIWWGIFIIVFGAPFAEAQKPKARESPPYTVLVNLRFSSPFVPDGRMSLSELAFSVTFQSVVFLFDPTDESLGDSFYCGLDAPEGRGWISTLSLNEVEPESPRHKAHFLKPPPKRFTAVLSVKKEPLEPGSLPIVPFFPPEKNDLCFRTTFGRNKIIWGAQEGGTELSELETCFEVPWAKLIKGEQVSVTKDYQGTFAEDRGTWWVEFLPRKKHK